MYTLFVAVTVVVYAVKWGPGKFLWFSDIALIGTVPALWLESGLLAGMMTISILLPEILWNLSFFVQLASEGDRPRVLALIRDHARPFQRIFVGVTDPISPHIETPDQVADRVVEAARYIPLDRLGTTDDCGFSPFADDESTARDTAFAKVKSRVEGTHLAAQRLGV